MLFILLYPEAKLGQIQGSKTKKVTTFKWEKSQYIKMRNKYCSVDDHIQQVKYQLEKKDCQKGIFYTKYRI
jgi:hypothetical protein